MEIEESNGLVPDVADGVYQTLISTSEATELTRRLCEQFALSSLYTYAWFGEYDEDANAVTPKAAEGIELSELDRIELDGETTRPGPHERAVETHALQVLQNGVEVSTPGDGESSSTDAAPETHVVLPLVSEERLYGVLHLVTDWPDAFGAGDRDSLEELAGRIGYALAHSEIDDRDGRPDALDIDEGLDNALKTLPDLFYVLDTEGNLVHWNESVEAVTGYDEDDLSSMHHTDFITGDDADRADEAFRRIIDGKSLEQIETTLVTKDGDAIPIESKSTALENENGDVVGVCGTARNIVERKRRERQIARQRDQLSNLKDQILETVPTGVSIFDSDGKLVQFNSRAADILQIDESHLGKSCLENPHWNVFDADGDSISPSNLPLSRVLETGEPVFNEELELEHPDRGTTWVVVNAAPLSDEVGETTVIIAVEEITERKARERSLQKVKNRLEAATEAGVVGTFEWRVADDEIVADPTLARLFGVDAEAARAGVSLERFISSIHEDDRDQVRRRIHETVEFDEMYDVEYRVLDADDEVRWVMARGHVDHETAPDSPVFHGAVTDITERETRNRQLERQNSRLESFASMLAHELRNPLNIAQIYSQHARSGDDEAFDKVETAHERIEEMIDILLILSRGVDSEISSEAVSLEKVATEVWSNLDVPSSQLVVDSDVTIEVDPLHLQHILENLFENAAEHAEKTVNVEVGRLECGFYVEDDGSGIPEPKRDRIFEAGFTTEEDGIGLGLTFISQIADAYEWDYRVVDGEYGGARFEFVEIETHSAE